MKVLDSSYEPPDLAHTRLIKSCNSITSVGRASEKFTPLLRKKMGKLKMYTCQSSKFITVLHETISLPVTFFTGGDSG